MIHERRRKPRSKGIRKVPLVLFSYFLFVLLIAWYFENQATSTLIVVRHAEKALVPADDPHFTHTAEGPDDMPSHIKMALTRTSETVPVGGGRLLSFGR